MCVAMKMTTGCMEGALSALEDGLQTVQRKGTYKANCRKTKKRLENAGIDPATSRMLSESSTISAKAGEQ